MRGKTAKRLKQLALARKEQAEFGVHHLYGAMKRAWVRLDHAKRGGVKCSGS